MPPYPEKQSPLLVRLKQKKPLMESENLPQPSSTTNNGDTPKLTDTVVRQILLSSRRIFCSFFFVDSFKSTKPTAERSSRFSRCSRNEWPS